MRHRSILAVTVFFSLGVVVARHQDEPSKKPRETPASKPARADRKLKAPLPEGHEEAALAFVRTHHPELAALLEQLKAMKPGEYSRAIAELYQVSRSLDNLKQNNPRRYELGLQIWKAKSKAELLAAKLVSAPSTELESQLRTALENQLDLEIRQQELEKEQIEARLKLVESTIKRLNDNRDKQIESRLQGLRNKVQRARRLDAGKSAPPKPVRTKGETKA